MNRDELRATMQGVRDSLRAGVRPISAPSLFPTPPAVAARLVEALELFPGCTVLEPSAGTGALVSAIRQAEPSAKLTALELSPELCRRFGWIQADFLATPSDRFDRVAMNPPFCNGADVNHVLWAVAGLAPGGVLVAIVADGPRQERAFEGFETLERLPAGTFAGTQVRARMIRWRAEP